MSDAALRTTAMTLAESDRFLSTRPEHGRRELIGGAVFDDVSTLRSEAVVDDADDEAPPIPRRPRGRPAGGWQALCMQVRGITARG